MAKLNTLSVLLFFSLCCLLHAAEPGRSPSPTGAPYFIKSECRITRYPALCIQTLSIYSSTIQTRRQLAQVALSVSLSRARSAATFISRLARIRGMKPSEYAAVKDCVASVGASVDQLSRSMRELGGLRPAAAGGDFEWHVSNVLTWVSSALTNADTCLGGFSGAAMDGRVKAAVRRRIVDCAQVTSNALALINRFAVRHK